MWVEITEVKLQQLICRYWKNKFKGFLIKPKQINTLKSITQGLLFNEEIIEAQENLRYPESSEILLKSKIFNLDSRRFSEYDGTIFTQFKLPYDIDYQKDYSKIYSMQRKMEELEKNAPIFKYLLDKWFSNN